MRVSRAWDEQEMVEAGLRDIYEWHKSFRARHKATVWAFGYLIIPKKEHTAASVFQVIPAAPSLASHLWVGCTALSCPWT